MHPTPLHPAALTSILIKVRDDTLAAERAARAQMPPDLGFAAQPTATRRIVVPEDLGQRFLRWLAEQGVLTDITDGELQDPLKGRGDGIASGGLQDVASSGADEDDKTEDDHPPADGGPLHRGPMMPPDLDQEIRAFLTAYPAPPARLTTARAASEIRATITQGVQGAFLDAARRRDSAMVQGHVLRAINQLKATGLPVPPCDRTMLDSQALSVLASVQRQVASEERVPPAIDLTQSAPPRSPSPALAMPSKEAASETPDTNPSAPVPAVSVPTIKEMLQKCITLKNDKEWNSKTVSDALTTTRMFSEYRGDVPIDQITTADAFNFKQLLIGVPKLAGKGRFAGLTIQQLVAEADTLEQALNDGAVEPADIRGISVDEDGGSWHVERYSIATINKHLNFMHTVLKIGQEYLGRDDDRTVFSKQFYKKALIRAQRKKRSAYDANDLECLFRTPAWTGCVDDRLRTTPSNTLPPRDARFWAPLVAAHQGMRLEECLQLRPEDIDEKDGIQVIRIREGKGQKLKTASSARIIPVHSTLIHLGFLQYAAERKADGSAWLYPELKRGGKFNTFGHSYSMWWTEYRRVIGVYEPGRDFHSFRTTVNTQLLRQGVNETTIKALLGHSVAGDITGEDYNAGLTLADLRRALELWHFDVSHLVR